MELREQNNDNVGSSYYKKLKLVAWSEKLPGTLGGRQNRHQDTLQTAARVISNQGRWHLLYITDIFSVSHTKQRCENVLAGPREYYMKQRDQRQFSCSVVLKPLSEVK